MFPHPEMHSFPSNIQQNHTWKDVGLPLRVISCEALVKDNKIEWVKPTSWDFVIISHRWLENVAWKADHIRPYPAAGGIMVQAVRRESLRVLARLCQRLKWDYFWIDCICIDQKSQLEKAREIVNMANYYKLAAKTLIFPFGVDKVGPPLDREGEAPVWHSRAWTLQEEAMSGDRAHFVLCLPGTISQDQTEDINPIMSCHQTNDDKDFLQSFANFVPVESGDKRTQDKAYLYLVKKEKMTNWRNSYLEYLDVNVQEKARETIHLLKPLQVWTLWSALREMFRRDASNPEDRLYSLLGFIGVTLEPNEIQYGIGLRAALRKFIRALHFDQRLLVTVVEAYHGNFIDGYGTLPDFGDKITSRPAPLLTHIRTLGTADFLGHEGMQITAPSITVDLEMRDILEEQGDILEEQEQGTMTNGKKGPRRVQYGFIQLVNAAQRKSSTGDAWIQPGHPSLDVTLIAVTEIHPMHGRCRDIK
ncbi:uncharacterized protein LTHEOB_7433 [Lasiodiplodia theobromae]|uniref:uncharacterized protein n=1 Tax=Lasiodiplodia theobromae TaxID=45133 RepID=UPI0015C35828|nr:uncharacterized protein LTHEOB_7433 [Lasiodiplodia theobromae]KAF4542703.1 hypothetical protein LTHEOB_7433 [Lasiodiplodia theobromae]